MFETLGHFFAGYRAVAHVAEATGLSVTALVCLGIVIYGSPTLRRLAIEAAVVVVVIYLVFVHSYRLGSGDVRAQWDDANAKVEVERQARDAEARKDAESKYDPEIRRLGRELTVANAKAETYAQELKKKGDAKCVLGNGPLRLRQRQ